jgi:prepilin-type N-terminal cleavage/methylation domain-containing protein
LYRRSIDKEFGLGSKGFTLVELLVTTVIIGILAAVSATVISSVLKSQNKTVVINEVRQNGDLLIDRLERDVKAASDIPSHTDYSVELIVGSDTINWVCDPAAGTFERNTVSVVNTDAVTGVRVVDAGTDGCQFKVTDASLVGTRLVTLKFKLEQGTNAPNKSEFKARVPFEVTIGTRSSQ